MSVLYAGEKLPAQHTAMPVCWCSHGFHRHLAEKCSGADPNVSPPCECTGYRPSGARV